MIRHHRVFPGRSADVPRARHFVAWALTDSPVRDDAVLLTSELATNAVLHTRTGQPGGAFAVSVEITSSWVRIEVRDEGAAPGPVQPPGPTRLRGSPLPRRRGQAPPYDDSGRGLFIVEHLANRWGTARDAPWHLVWFELDIKDPEPGGDPPASPRQR